MSSTLELSFWINNKMSLVEKLGKFAMYEIGDPMLNRITYNSVQARLSLEEREYFEAMKSSIVDCTHCRDTKYVFVYWLERAFERRGNPQINNMPTTKLLEQIKSLESSSEASSPRM